MKSTRVMSIIGIILFSICLIAALAFIPEATIDSGYTAADIENAEATMGAGALAIIYGLALSITALVQSNNVINREE